MPPKFSFPENQKVWIPLGADRREGPADQPQPVHVRPPEARRGPGAGARRHGVDGGDRSRRSIPLTNDGWSAIARPLADEFIPDDVRLVLLTMMGAVTLVLLIACANVANLMLARASGRQREFSVRAALGAGRARMVRQLLTECVLLGLAAAPLGLAHRLLRRLAARRRGAARTTCPTTSTGRSARARHRLHRSPMSALTGLVFGLAPALQAGRLNLQEALRDGARGSGQSGRRARVRNGLVIAEVALALVLLVGASLFVRSFLNLQSASPGFDTAPLLTLRFYMTGDAYATAEQKAQRVEDIVRRIEGAARACESALRLELHPARRRRRRRQRDRRRPRRAEGRGAGHQLHRRDAASPQDDGAARCSRAATSPTPKAPAARRWR